MHVKETAVLGGGCFWCTEAIFSRLSGVESVVSGYAGGDKMNPTYDNVIYGNTGHAEVVKIEFDPSIIPYKRLLDVFWATHDPTTPNRQGADTGAQYRSIILYTSNEQKKQAEESAEKLQKERKFANPVITEIRPLKAFYTAEEYHQKYYDSGPDRPYCQLVISPKLDTLLKTFPQLLKD